MNFKHLHYFWVTAKAGGIMRAGEQLHTTPQTLSGQIKLLEEWLGRKLFQKSGRNLELTEDGRLALGYADQIFRWVPSSKTRCAYLGALTRCSTSRSAWRTRSPSPWPTAC